ncbi:TetR/AcrR family transcriptional regulator [Humibacter albus]|uniref:TetR/AcrR family transcriptional regulator n=1 Tax=Humibacter albus TaxID=427754 RepID=UPI0003B698B2|nr:TetR/AcrR family transcriptional regulator [Humibacter albus]
MSSTRQAKRAATAQRILEAAQEEFALHGFGGATIRSIGERAGVHPSLVMQHYGSKADLFAIAVKLPSDDDRSTADHLADVLDVRLTDLPPQTRALVKSMLTSPEAEAHMRDFLQERIENLTASMEGSDAAARATIAVSGILGLTIARHFLSLPAFDEVTPDELRRAAREWADAVAQPTEPPGSEPGSR